MTNPWFDFLAALQNAPEVQGAGTVGEMLKGMFVDPIAQRAMPSVYQRLGYSPEDAAQLTRGNFGEWKAPNPNDLLGIAMTYPGFGITGPAAKAPVGAMARVAASKVSKGLETAGETIAPKVAQLVKEEAGAIRMGPSARLQRKLAKNTEQPGLADMGMSEKVQARMLGEVDPAEEAVKRAAAAKQAEEKVAERVRAKPLPGQLGMEVPPPTVGAGAGQGATPPTGFTRLYRAETNLTPEELANARPVSEWLKQSPEYQGTVQATDRWFSDTLDNAKYYAEKFGDGRITYVDVPTADLEKFRVSNMTADIRKFARRPEDEFFIPRELASARKAIAVDVTPALTPSVRTPGPSTALQKFFGEIDAEIKRARLKAGSLKAGFWRGKSSAGDVTAAETKVAELQQLRKDTILMELPDDVAAKYEEAWRIRESIPGGLGPVETSRINQSDPAYQFRGILDLMKKFPEGDITNPAFRQMVKNRYGQSLDEIAAHVSPGGLSESMGEEALISKLRSFSGKPTGAGKAYDAQLKQANAFIKEVESGKLSSGPTIPLEEDIRRRTEAAYERYRKGAEEDFRKAIEETRKKYPPEQGGPLPPETAGAGGAGLPPKRPTTATPLGETPPGPSGPQMGLSQMGEGPRGPIPGGPVVDPLSAQSRAKAGRAMVDEFSPGGAQPGLVGPGEAGPPRPPVVVAQPSQVPPVPPSTPALDKILALAREQVRQDRPGALTNLLQKVPGLKQLLQFERPGLKMQGPNENVLTAHIAETAAKSSVSALATSSRVPLLKSLTENFGKDALKGGKVNVPFLGTAEEAASPLTGTLKDIADNPQLYQLSPAQTQALQAMDARNTALLSHVTEGYGAKIGAYPAKEGGAYLPNVDKETQDLAQAIETDTRGIARGVGQERVWPTARDRMASDPRFVPETNVEKLIHGIDTFKAGSAGGLSYRQAIGGKTKLEVLQETNPALYAKMMNLRKRLVSLQGSAGTIDANLHTAINDFLSSAPVEGADSLGNLRNALDIKLKGGPLRGAKLADVQGQIDGVKAQIKALQPAWDIANPKPYRLVKEGLYRYFPADQAALIAKSRQVTDNPLLKFIESWRGQAFSGDFSPFAIQDAAGVLADPIGSLKAGAGLVRKGAETGDFLRSVKVEALAKDIADNPADWQEFAAIMGRSISGTPKEFAAGLLSKVPGFDAFTEGTYITVTRSTKALYDRTWKSLVASGMPELQAKVTAGTVAGQIFPLVTPARLGQSEARAAVLRALPTSYSFIRQPASIMANAAKGYMKLGLRKPLTGQESLSVKLMTTMAATVLTASATSAAINAHLQGKDPRQAMLDAINPDPKNGKFASLVFGDMRVPLGGPYRSIFRAIYPQEVSGVPVPVPFAGIPQYLANRVTPAARTQVDLLRNEDYYGNTIIKGKFPEQLLRGLAYEMENALPLSAGAVAEGVRTGRDDTAQQAIGTFAGANLMTPSARQKELERKSTLVGAPWDDLMATQQKAARAKFPEIRALEAQGKDASGSFADYAGKYFTGLYSNGKDVVDRLPEPQRKVLDQAGYDLSLTRNLQLAGGQEYYLNDARWKAYQDLLVSSLTKRLASVRPLTANATPAVMALREKTIKKAVTDAKNDAEKVANTPMTSLRAGTTVGGGNRLSVPIYTPRY